LENPKTGHLASPRVKETHTKRDGRVPKKKRKLSNNRAPAESQLAVGKKTRVVERGEGHA